MLRTGGGHHRLAHDPSPACARSHAAALGEVALTEGAVFRGDVVGPAHRGDARVRESDDAHDQAPSGLRGQRGQRYRKTTATVVAGPSSAARPPSRRPARRPCAALQRGRRRDQLGSAHSPARPGGHRRLRDHGPVAFLLAEGRRTLVASQFSQVKRQQGLWYTRDRYWVRGWWAGVTANNRADAPPDRLVEIIKQVPRAIYRDSIL